MLLRAVLAWVGILVLAILNGGLRQGFLIPGLGESVGRILSPILLALLVAGAAWIAVPWIRPGTGREAWLVGVLWLVLTLAFEFLAGHYLFGNSWERLLAEYDVARGRLWILVPITTLVAPALVHTVRSNQT
jgi:hypothetical protein